MEIRKAQRECFCRGCDKKILKDEVAFFTHSWRNRGQHIMFCEDCLNEINTLRCNYVD